MQEFFVSGGDRYCPLLLPFFRKRQKQKEALKKLENFFENFSKNTCIVH
jgi:hypothetical protein